MSALVYSGPETVRRGGGRRPARCCLRETSGGWGGGGEGGCVTQRRRGERVDEARGWYAECTTSTPSGTAVRKAAIISGRWDRMAAVR